MIRIALRIDWEIAAKAFDSAFRRFEEGKKVNVHQVLDDVVTLRQFISGKQFLDLLSAPFAIVFILIGWAFHPYLAVFIFVATLLQLMAAITTYRITSPALREANSAAFSSSNVASQYVSKSSTALALGMQQALRFRWFKKHQHALGLQVNASETAGLVGGITSFMTHALPSAQIALGAFLAIEGLITGGMVIAASFLLARSMGPIRGIIGGWPSIIAARQSVERLNRLVVEDQALNDAMKLPLPHGILSVDRLSINVTPTREILKDISFRLEPGQVLGIIGPTASGKTSLARALVGLWEPSSGHVRLDGADVYPWIRKDLGERIGWVPLEVDLFDGTIAENIARLGDVDSEKVVAATRAVGIHETILSYPKGYDTQVSEASQLLTGGQRQRIAIARALYGDPVLIVMDEPNAHLDDQGEAELIKTIQQLKLKKATIIFTTHRPRLIGAADWILVLSEGKVAVHGPRAKVLATFQRAGDAAKEAKTS
jgi:PrtD family type I secretion system ABC transporter